MLDELNLGPDDLLKKVEEFGGTSQIAEHSYQALVSSGEDMRGSPVSEFWETQKYAEDEFYSDDDIDDDVECELLDEGSSIPLGSLPVDRITRKFREERK